ncbi:unnamed protein product [Cyprideis torosa]|uniref:Peroxiredoxin-5 n=1 Tax=Cyprideis torosa TaxID=163714 RepID=A0A7R8WAN0_9CRUS|nr:unnamed protein product [Cyprideis torosa]CAG0888584.1 unnamed protein product [Cyprideis torosa]
MVFEDSPVTGHNIAEFCKGKNVVLFGVPGAFTPGCSQTHLPSYVERADELRSQGIDEIICVSVNDPFVVSAWGKHHEVEKKGIKMFADTNCEFTKALGLEIDLSKALGSVRSKRYSMLLEDGVVKQLNVEPDGTGLTCSLAGNIKMRK